MGYGKRKYKRSYRRRGRSMKRYPTMSMSGYHKLPYIGGSYKMEMEDMWKHSNDLKNKVHQWRKEYAAHFDHYRVPGLGSGEGHLGDEHNRRHQRHERAVKRKHDAMEAAAALAAMGGGGE